MENISVHEQQFVDIALHMIETEPKLLQELTSRHQAPNLRSALSMWQDACEVKDPEFQKLLLPKVAGRLLDYAQTVYNVAANVALEHSPDSAFHKESLKLQIAANGILSDLTQKAEKDIKKRYGFSAEHGESAKTSTPGKGPFLSPN